MGIAAAVIGGKTAYDVKNKRKMMAAGKRNEDEEETEN